MERPQRHRLPHRAARADDASAERVAGTAPGTDMAGPAGTNWSGANHSGQHYAPLPGLHSTSEMGGPISRSARPKDLMSPEDFARTKTIAWCAIVAVMLGALSGAAVTLTVRAWRLGEASIDVTSNALLGCAVMALGVVGCVAVIFRLRPVAAVLASIVIAMGGVIGGVILMMRPGAATPITPVAMAGAGAVAFALMTLLSYRTARWLEATGNGMGAKKMRELVSGFLGAIIIVAIMVAIDPHGEIFVG